MTKGCAARPESSDPAELPRPEKHLPVVRITVNDTDLYVDVEGPELAVDIDGDLRAGPTLVVLHGGPGFDQGYLRPGLRALAADAQLVFVDLRGQGRSGPAPVESCTLEQMADDVATLCTALGIPRPVVSGHSAGGFVALQLALRQPELASGRSSAIPRPRWPRCPIRPRRPGPPRGGPDAGAAAARLFGCDFSPEAVEAFGRLVFPLYAAPGHVDVPPRLMALSTLNTEMAAHFFQKLAAHYDVRPGLPTITAPSLVAVGAHDWVCPAAAGRALAADIPGARLVELSDAGHFGFSETPEPFLDVMRAHLAAAETRTPVSLAPSPPSGLTGAISNGPRARTQESPS